MNKLLRRKVAIHWFLATEELRETDTGWQNNQLDGNRGGAEMQGRSGSQLFTEGHVQPDANKHQSFHDHAEDGLSLLTLSTPIWSRKVPKR